MTVATILLAEGPLNFKFYADPMEAMAALIRDNQYNKIGSIDTDKTGKAAAEDMFDLSNNPQRDDERQLRWGRYRSLSVGDVVHVDNESFLCLSMGWQKL